MHYSKTSTNLITKLTQISILLFVVSTSFPTNAQNPGQLRRERREGRSKELSQGSRNNNRDRNTEQAQHEESNGGITIRCNTAADCRELVNGQSDGQRQNPSRQQSTSSEKPPTNPTVPTLTVNRDGINITPRNVNQRILGDKRASSSLFKECQSLIPADESWLKITTRDRSDTKNIWTQAWNKFRHEKSKDLEELDEETVTEPDDLKKVQAFYENFNKELKDFHDLIAQCEAMRALTAYAGMDEKSLKWGAEATKKSVDGKIVCNSVGPETQDYKACLTALNSYNAALVGTAVFTQIQTVKYQGDSIENAAGVNPNNPTSALEVQKRDIEGRANITQQRAGLDAAKLAGMGTLLYNMPTHQKLLDYCGESSSISYGPIKEEFKNLKKEFYQKNRITISTTSPVDYNSALAKIILDEKEKIDSYDSSNSEPMKKVYCRQALNRSKSTLIANTAAKDEIKRAMIVAGVDMTKHQLTANQLKKQANQVGKIINEVDNFNPEDLPQFQGQDFNGSECVLDPSAEGCDDFVDERSFGFQDRGAIQINGLENASSFSRNSDDPRSRGDDDSGSGDFGGNTAPPKPIGIFDPRVADKSGFDGRMPSAAGVTSNGPEAAQGGSGGGPSGGGSPPASQVPQQKSDDGPRLGGAGNSTANYSGGGGSLRTRGGGGSLGRGSSDDEDGNPFAELFGDKDPTRSETLNFRETASAENQINTPDTSIFEIISERYTNVRKQDRLLEYKVKNSEELQ